MIFSSFKTLKTLDLYASDVVPLFHQTSDKRLLRTNGEGIKSLTGFKNWSPGSSDPHSERTEVRTESLLSLSINLRKIVLRSAKSWFWKVTDWKKLRFPKICRSESLSPDNPTLFIGMTNRKASRDWRLIWNFVREAWIERNNRADNRKMML